MIEALCLALAMPLAPALVRAANRWRPSGHLWTWQEVVRGWGGGCGAVGGVI